MSANNKEARKAKRVAELQVDTAKVLLGPWRQAVLEWLTAAAQCPGRMTRDSTHRFVSYARSVVAQMAVLSNKNTQARWADDGAHQIRLEDVDQALRECNLPGARVLTRKVKGSKQSLGFRHECALTTREREEKEKKRAQSRAEAAAAAAASPDAMEDVVQPSPQADSSSSGDESEEEEEKKEAKKHKK